MARRRSYRIRRPKLANTFSVRVYMPDDVDVPPVLALRKPKQQQRRTRAVTVPLGSKRGRRMIRRTVRLIAPRSALRMRLAPTYVIARSNSLRIQPEVRALAILEREMNRKWRLERKRRRRKYHHGQLESVRSDRLDMVGSAIRRGSDIRTVADAAMVSRALGAS